MTQDKPGCWTENATPRPWIKADRELQKTIAVHLGFEEPVYSDPSIVCLAYETITHATTKAKCAGCARIPRGK